MAKDFVAFNPDTGVLQNAGVKVRLHRTLVSGAVDPSAEELVNNYVKTSGVEEIAIVFDMRVLAGIEEMFGSIQQWQEALTTKPHQAVLKTLMVITGRTGRDIAAAVHLPSVTEYQMAISYAHMQAMGVDKATLGKLMAAAKMSNALQEQQEAALTELLTAALSRLATGSAPGSSSDATTTSSGDEALDKSDSSSTSPESSPKPKPDTSAVPLPGAKPRATKGKTRSTSASSSKRSAAPARAS